METNYNVDYFIKKFEAIPESRWCVLAYEDGSKRCAYGHCDYENSANGYHTEQGKALLYLFKKIKITPLPTSRFVNPVMVTNDGDSKEYQQATPKQRILAALRDIKKMQGSQNTVSSEQNVHVCDATEADSSTQAGNTTLYPDLTKSLAVLPQEKKEVDILLVTP